MRRDVHTTGPYGIGSMAHTTHVVEDIHVTNAWYEDVFGGIIFMGNEVPSYMEVEKRAASFIQISDVCVETIGPDMPLDLSTAMARFLDRQGAGYHSMCYCVEDVLGLREHLASNDVPTHLTEINDTKFFFTSPKYTNGLTLEILNQEVPGDPMARNEWSSLRKLWVNHPLGIEAASHYTFGVNDLAVADETWTKLFAPERLDESYDEALRAEALWYRVGVTVVQLARPTEDGSPLAEYVAKRSGAMYATTFTVVDLDRAEAHLRSKGIGTSRPSDDTVAAEPADCFGAAYFFSTKGRP